MEASHPVLSAVPAARQDGHVVRVAAREEVARGTIAVRFTRPPGLRFRAGQNLEVTLPLEGGRVDSRTLSIASAPSDDEIVVVARAGPSDFKQALATLPPGAAARVAGPYGSLVLHRATTRDVVMVAGGIGITPFRSILRQAAREGDPRRFVLLYSNRDHGSAAYLDELQRLQLDWGRFRLVATMTADPAWSGERRVVGAPLVREAALGLSAPIHYLAGPPGMVAASHAALAEAGVDDDDVRGEEFFGYEHAPEAP